MRGIIDISTELLADKPIMAELFELLPIVEKVTGGLMGCVRYVAESPLFDEDMAQYCPTLERNEQGKLYILYIGKI